MPSDEYRQYRDRLENTFGYTVKDTFTFGSDMQGLRQAFDADGAYWYMSRDTKHCIVAFRASDSVPFGDILDNQVTQDKRLLKVFASDRLAKNMRDTTNYRGVLQGVSASVAKELDQVLGRMREKNAFAQLRDQCEHITATGWSLGGAMAGLFSVMANKNKDPLQLGGVYVDEVHPLSQRTAARRRPPTTAQTTVVSPVGCITTFSRSSVAMANTSTRL